MDDIQKTIEDSRLWDNFMDELIYKNRYFPNDGEFLDCVDRIVPFLVDTVEKKSEWYRAREYEIDKPSDSFTDNLELLSEEEREKEKEKRLRAVLEYSLYSYVPRAFNYFENKEIPQHLSEIIKEKEKTSIWGYSEKESGMPPRDKAGLNRASPKYISYLYLASDITTALAEARALPYQNFSVAKYITTKKLNIINLCKLINNKNLTSKELTLCSHIFSAFSSPSHSNEKDYLVSQFITEYIKRIDYDGIMFDGIQFNSSRNADGTNLTLFDDSACKFLGSSIHEVTEIKVESQQLLPFMPKQLY